MTKIVRNMEILNRLLEKQILPEVLKESPSDLSLSQFNILYYLYTHKNVRPKDLAGALSITSPAATYALQRLNSSGFVDISTAKLDKREKFAILTDKGSKAVKYIVKSKEKLISDIFYSLDKADQFALLQGLRSFLAKAATAYEPQELCLNCGFRHLPDCVLSKDNDQTIETSEKQGNV